MTNVNTKALVIQYALRYGLQYDKGKRMDRKMMNKDTIYREDAIKALGDEPMVWTLEDEYTMGQRSQWRADVTAIESIPSTDTFEITKEALIEAINNAETVGDIVKNIIDKPQGEWIVDSINKNNMYCSNCKVSYTKDFLRGMSLYHEPKDTPNFCPNCGCRMKGVNDE